MAASSLAIHILPDSKPQNTKEMLQILAREEKVFETIGEFDDYMKLHSSNMNSWVRSTAQSMGLLTDSKDCIQRTKTGEIVTSLRAEVQSDIFHFLMYTGWNAKRPLDFPQSWAYRICCNVYWEAQSIELTIEYKNRRVEEVINDAQKIFHELTAQEFNKISFSVKSLRGLHNWLTSLEPPVIENNVFTRRSFCHPELLLLAIGYMIQEEDIAIDTDILISRDRRNTICKICLMEPDALDRALDWMIPIFPEVIEEGTTAGFYGRFIRLHKIPEIGDIVR